MTAATPPFLPNLLVSDGFEGYRLVDCGEGRKLERFGRFLVDRPEPQAMGRRHRPELWSRADAVFMGMNAEDEGSDGRWKFAGRPVETFPAAYRGVAFHGRFTPFRHLGFFPEQAPHWDFMVERLKGLGRPAKVLNLFGYTGVASLLAAKAGAAVTHVDASKKSIGFARENQALAGLTEAPIRWIVDDAVKFTAREERRGSRYDGVVLDPPKYGRGPNGEVWDLFTDLPHMLELTRAVLVEKPSFVIVTAYAIRASFIAIHELAREVFSDLGGRLESGELAVREEGGGRLLSTSLYSRWSAP
ncbi:class I SAM-dependent methyltransferase [Labrys wisconsinensis]|uniref:23S rRNA (Cytosine1962-C5)-methyltransferase n=1 Tax=Labrys wisconsinensis TaxID=425677 RepID=A0ABU0JHK7_9HYPH|nr:class I SAM-dependent methyltransferase [Labrys wisconsinensis]MDQ0472592.1 23S rRNA (cytosine1962-C5)-methyltransferase [Labrys wisconsinensis]